MIPSGLTLEQAPPLSVPLRFFVTAPAFGFAASALLVVRPQMLSSRWSPALLAGAHLFLLGVLVMVMLGALQQMGPVVVGASFRAPRLLGGVVHAAWTLGAVALPLGLGTGARALVGSGAALLVVAAAAFVVAASPLALAPARTGTAWALRLACVSFLVVVGMGALLAAGHVGLTPLRRFTITDLHLAWGLVGWIGALILGACWQVVPMLLMTPAYPRVLRAAGVPTLLALLLAWSLAPQGAPRSIVQALAAALLATFAIVTLHRLARRRRQVRDATVDLFRFAMACLLLACGLHVAHAATGLGADRLELVVVLLYALGFASTVVVGMLLKVLPFLCWFHLQAMAGRLIAEGRSAPAVPTMKDVLPDERAFRIARLHAGACVPVILAPVLPPPLASLAGGALAASFALLGVTLAVVAARAARTMREFG